MPMRPRARTSAAALLIAAAVGAAGAQVPATRSFRVRETVGIRRTEYPVAVRFTFQKGALKDASQARLVFNDAEVVGQFAAASKWDDGSVQALDVDFNASLDPEEERRYQLQYGPGVTSIARPARGALTPQDQPDAIQVGNFKIGKRGAPLLMSVSYRGEGIGPGTNGLSVTDTTGEHRDLSGAHNPKLEIVRPGPVTVGLRYTATLPIGSGYSVPVEILIDLPSSKSWVKMAATVRDPSRRVRDIAINTPLAFGALPILWDFATDSGTYGVLRNAGDMVLLTQTKSAAGARWKIETAVQDQQPRMYELSAGPRAKMASGWGHIQDAKAAVAFGIDHFARENGTYTLTLTGKGETTFRFAPAAPATEHHLTVYEHFVATPVAIGAATNPTAMLHPLEVTIER